MKSADAVLGVLNVVTVVESVLTSPEAITVFSTTIADVSVGDAMEYTIDVMFRDPKSDASISAV